MLLPSSVMGLCHGEVFKIVLLLELFSVFVLLTFAAVFSILFVASLHTITKFPFFVAIVFTVSPQLLLIYILLWQFFQIEMYYKIINCYYRLSTRFI